MRLEPGEMAGLRGTGNLVLKMFDTWPLGHLRFVVAWGEYFQLLNATARQRFAMWLRKKIFPLIYYCVLLKFLCQPKGDSG